MAASLQGPLSSVPKVAIVERFDFIRTSENEASTLEGRSDRRLRRTTATLPQSDKGRLHISVNDVVSC